MLADPAFRIVTVLPATVATLVSELVNVTGKVEFAVAERANEESPYVLEGMAVKLIV